MRFASRIVLRFASLIVCDRLLGADNLDYFQWNSSTLVAVRFASRIVLRFASLIVCERLLGADNLDYFKWNSSTTQIWGRILVVFLSGPLCTKGPTQIEGHILGRICVVFLSGPLCTKGTAQIWGRIGLDLFTSSAVGHGCSLEVAVQHWKPRLSFGNLSS